MANDPNEILANRVYSLQLWLNTHGGAVDENDTDAQRDLIETFIVPLLAAAWAEGFQSASDLTPMGFAPDGPDDRDNPYVPTPPACQHESRGCCGFRADHDHGDCDGYVFTARDYWTGMTVAVSQDAEEHVRTLFAHGPHKDHCKGYEVHAWPCYPASVVLSDLRTLIGPQSWGRVDPFAASPDFRGDQ